MANTLPIQRHNIEVYHEGKFVGYVHRVTGIGASVVVEIHKKKYGFNKRRCEGIKKSAEVANICTIDGGQKLYNQRDNLKFKMVREVNDE